MITICSIREAKPADYDEIWAIVRSWRSKSGTIIHVPELSPSPALYGRFLSWKNNGTWNPETFRNSYAPVFLRQMRTDRRAQEKLDELVEKDRNGKKIALVCFCTDASICHRSLIGELLAERGIPYEMK